MNDNKITSNLSVSEGLDKTGGRKYGRDWSTYQATGGYKAPTNHSHRETNDKTQENSHQRKIGTFGDHVANRAKIDVRKGSNKI